MFSERFAEFCRSRILSGETRRRRDSPKPGFSLPHRRAHIWGKPGQFRRDPADDSKRT